MSSDTTLSTEANDAAFDLAVVLADTEMMSAHRYSEHAMLGAPGIEEDIALSSVIQDELGHARTLYRTAADVGDRSVDHFLYERPPAEWRSPTVLDTDLGSWADVVTSLGVLDFATVLVYENLRDGEFEALRSVAGKVLQEESQHVQHGQAWFSVFADGSDPEYPAANLQASIDRIVPGVARWLGSDGGSATLTEAGVFDRSNAAMREEFLSEIETVIEASGFDVPEVSFDWSDWDESTRRPSPPSGEAFETAVDEATGRNHRDLA